MNIPLTFGHYEGRSTAVNAMQLINMMVEGDQQGGATPYSLVGTPGCKSYVDLGKYGEGRGGYYIPGYIIAVVHKYVFYIDTSSGYAAEAGQLTTTTGAVQFAENPDEVMITDGANGYIFNKSTQTLNVITDADFPTPLSCAWKDGYGVAIEDSSGKFYVSAINDFSSWDALSFTTAEFEPDNLVGCAANHDSLFAFGETSTQIYYNSGNATYPFDTRPGASLMIGCGATNSPAVGNNLVFWLDNNGMVRSIAGYNQNIISTQQIHDTIAGFSTFSDARGHCYTQSGHTFYVLTFPTDKTTLVYDLTTGQWHKRASGETDGRYRATWFINGGAKVYAGDYGNGQVYELDFETYTDNAEVARWFATSQNVNNDRKMIAHDLLELHIESGVGLATGQGDDPQLWMQYSDDDGQTWSREKWRSMGKMGEYRKRLQWRALGQSRSRVYRFGGSDPVKRVLVSAHLRGRDLGH